MIELGFKPCPTDSNTFVKGEGDSKIVVAYQVDDGLVAYKSNEVNQKFIQDISKVFPTKHYGKVKLSRY